MLNMSETAITDEELGAICSCMDNIEKLAIGNSSGDGSNVTIQGIRWLAESIQKRTQPVKNIIYGVVLNF